MYNGGFLTQKRVRRILQLSGYDIRLGNPGPKDWVGVWGLSPTALRGKAVADKTDRPVLHVEDAFLRSVLPGRAGGGPPLGLLLDREGMHFDPARPSALESLLATHPLDDTALLDRARHALARLQRKHLSKYNNFSPAQPAPAPGYVLVVDQVRDDASLRATGAGQALFNEMLAFAQIENPGARILIRAHPETRAGGRAGYFDASHEGQGTQLYTDDVSPWALLEGAVAVYTVSSQLGFEAILAGHKPRVFGQPFYGGWGLTQDENPVPRRARRLTRPQLFAAAMILAPTWYDPFRDKLCTLETALDILEVQTRAWREDRHGWLAHEMRLWKRPAIQKFFGSVKPVKFGGRTKAAEGRREMAWAAKGPVTQTTTRVEDGFLRSRGLGAQLVPPLSLVTDSAGIYYDPSGPSDMEGLIAASTGLEAGAVARAERLIRRLIASGTTKYNLTAATAPPPPAQGLRILVPGQVEDDASVRLGCPAENSNLALLQRVRRENPDATILFKPHPDVEAGLRPGAVAPADLDGLADTVLAQTGAASAIDHSDAVWTMTSLMGFEALLRGKPVTCLGVPFYAGWGLTRDLVETPARRSARPSLPQMVHAVLIDYPRYYDPVTKAACPVEVAVDRLAAGQLPASGVSLRLLAKLQGALASYAHYWR